MVCLGNICRSPLAEGILKSKVNSKKVFVDSAGTAAYHVGHSPDKRSIAVAQKYGINIKSQRARIFSVKDFKKFDVIYAMDDSNFNDIYNLAQTENDRQKVKLILNESNPFKYLSVPDPYYGEEGGFENVYTMLDDACEIIAKKL